MAIDDDVDEFLEHFGVKGMKWGVRRERKSLSPKAKRAAQVAVVGGVVLAAAIIAHKSGVRLSSISDARSVSSVSGKREAEAILKRVGERRFSAIPMPPVRTPKPSTVPRMRKTTSAAGDISAMRATAAMLVREANADLRARDNDLNIPIHMRSYLKEWD